MYYKDQLHREIQFDETPKRIVSLVPSQTELLVDLGLEDRIVGLTKFCVHPEHIRKQKVVVGGTKTIHIEKIIALNPDIILCNKEENTEDMISQLESVAPVHISDIGTLEDCYELIEMYGNMFAVKNKAKELIDTIKNKHDDFLANLEKTTSFRVAYFIWREPWMVAASETFIDALLKVNRFENVFQHKTRYPEINLEELSESNANVVMLSSEPYPFTKKHIEELTTICPNMKVILVDGEYFSWYGSRLIQAFNYFSRLHQLLSSKTI